MQVLQDPVFHSIYQNRQDKFQGLPGNTCSDNARDEVQITAILYRFAKYESISPFSLQSYLLSDYQVHQRFWLLQPDPVRKV